MAHKHIELCSGEGLHTVSPSMGNTVVHFRSNFYPGDRKIKCGTGIYKK